MTFGRAISTSEPRDRRKRQVTSPSFERGICLPKFPIPRHRQRNIKAQDEGSNDFRHFVLGLSNYLLLPTRSNKRIATPVNTIAVRLLQSVEEIKRSPKFMDLCIAYPPNHTGPVRLHVTPSIDGGGPDEEGVTLRCIGKDTINLESTPSTSTRVSYSSTSHLHRILRECNLRSSV